MRITFMMMIGILITNFGNVVTEFIGIATSLELFGLSRFITVPVCGVIVWLIVVKGQYKSVEKVFLAASFFYITYIFAGVLAHPLWKDATIATFKPPALKAFRDQAYLFMVIGVVGTTIAPWMQFYLQASIVEKGVTKRGFQASRAGCNHRMRLHRHRGLVHHRSLRRDSLRARFPRHQVRRRCGPGAQAIGRRLRLHPVCRRIIQCFVVRCVDFAVINGVHRVRRDGIRIGRGQKIRRGAGILLALHLVDCGRWSVVLLIPGQQLVKIVLWSQVLNGVVLPFVLVFMLLLINKKELMGEYVNTRLFNVVAWTTTIVVIALSVALSRHDCGERARAGRASVQRKLLQQFSRSQLLHQRCRSASRKSYFGRSLGSAHCISRKMRFSISLWYSRTTKKRSSTIPPFGYSC